MRSHYFKLGRIALAPFTVALPPLRAEATTDAAWFVEGRANAVIEIFNNPKLSPDERETRLHALAVESFDVPSIARWVLGRYWATATAAERQEFTKEFEHYMVHIYASRFSRYQDAKVKIMGERPKNDRTLVRSEIVWRGSEQPAKVNWWITKAGNGYKILDVSIEGVSQMMALREEFASVIQQHDGKVAGLIEHLKEKTGG